VSHNVKVNPIKMLMKLVTLALLPLAAVIWIESTLMAADTEAKKLKVSVVQMRSSRDLNDNVARITNSIHQCGKQGAQVVVFPECALSSYIQDALTNFSAAELTAASEQVAEACRQAEAYTIVGTAWREGGKLLNSALIIAPTGKVIERYDKCQLAERWPEAGDHLSVFRIEGVPCSVIICHDERYPELVRLPVLAGAQVVFYVSHESGLREEKKLNPYRAQIQARAVENNVFIVHANAPANLDTTGSHGQSRIITPDGNIMSEASMFSEDVLTATLDLREATRNNAKKSVERGPLRDWWQEGIKRVQVID